MPKLQGYVCNRCNSSFEYLHMGNEPPVCSHCGSMDCEVQLGGRLFSTIIPDYPGAHRRKAGYVHQHVNRPAEKVSVCVPGRRGES